MDNALEVIRNAHQVDQLLGRLAEAVSDAGLKARIREVKEEWQPLCFEVSASLAGVETSGVPGGPRKRRSRKKAGEPAMSGEGAAGEE